MPNISNLPTAISALIQDGILEREIKEGLKPALLWRSLFAPVRHEGRIGESKTMTRDGLIAPSTRASALRTPGVDPSTVTRTVEQYTYRVAPYGKSIDTHLPSSFLAQANRFESDNKALVMHAMQTLGRFARDVLFAAYAGGNTFATTGTTSASLVVADATGFDYAVPSTGGPPAAVSASNTLAITVGGVAKTVIACDLTTNTLTLSASHTWSQYDAIVRADAPTMVRVNDRATDRLLVDGDVAVLSSFRKAAAILRGHNVPGLNGQVGGDYGVYIDSDIENALIGDTEFRTAVTGAGKPAELASGEIGRYGGMQFMRMPKSESRIIASASPYQTTIHSSLVFGAEPGIEAYIPDADFANEVNMGGAAMLNHYKMPIDPNGVATLVVRAPLDKAGEVISQSWLANCDWCIPSDSTALTGSQRHKRAIVVNSAGPA